MLDQGPCSHLSVCKIIKVIIDRLSLYYNALARSARFTPAFPAMPVRHVVLTNRFKSCTSVPAFLRNGACVPCNESTPRYCFKSFSCNTYESPRKCCKQKTYGPTKSFSCNTYKKHGGQVVSTSNLPFPKSLLYNLFADPHPLNLYATIFYKIWRGRGILAAPSSLPTFQRPNVPTFNDCSAYPCSRFPRTRSSTSSIFSPSKWSFRARP